MPNQHNANLRYVIGNWKCNKTLAEARLWLTDFARMYKPSPGLQVVIAPPLIWLSSLAEALKDLDLPQVSLAAQDVSPFPPGGYTGAIAADMLKGLAEFAIVGHSERRRYFHETAQDVTNKVSEAADAGICPIVCVDTSYAMSQLTGLQDVDYKNLIVAYTPVDTMSYREPESVERVGKATAFIRQIQPLQPIIYGGSIRPDNVERYVDIPDLSGFFVGAASLSPEDFQAICHVVA